MNIDSWLVNRIITSSNVNSYTTRCYPSFSPTTSIPPFIIYDSIGWGKNRNLKNKEFTLVSVNNSKSNVEAMNDVLYTLFDTSSSYIKQQSSSLRVERVDIINNAVCLYDDQNKYWKKILDISVWYF